MALDFTKLGEVGTVDKVLDTDTVLVERGGSIYRVAGNQLGGAGGFLFEPQVGEVTFDVDTQTIFVTSDVTDILAALNRGSPIIWNINPAIFGIEDGCSVFTQLLFLASGEVLESSYAGMYLGFVWFGETTILVVFTNGNPMPTSEASTTALRMKKGAGDGKS